MSAEAETNDLAQRELERRTFLIATAGIAASTAGLGAAAAQEGDTVLDFSSEMTPNPWLTGSATIDTVSPTMSDLGYINDNGEEVSLADDGAVLEPREDDETPYNPVRIRADHIESAEYTAFPRGETYDESGDGDANTDVRAVDSTHWTTDETGTAGTISVSDPDDDTLRVSTSGQTTGDVASATFSDFTIDEGEARRYLQLVANIDTLEAGAVITVKVVDAASNSVSATIDPSADASNDSVIATSQADGVGYQTQLGDLTGGADLDTIEELVIEVSEANGAVDFHGINLERESQWSYGNRERINSDDELETITVREPTGYTGISSVEDLRDSFPDADVRSVEFDIRFVASELPNSMFDIEVSDAERSDYPKRLDFVFGFEPPSAYELSISIDNLFGARTLASSRYGTYEFSSGLDEVPTLDDVEDTSWTSRTDQIKNGELDKEQDLSSTPSASSVTALHIDLNLEDEEVNSVTMQSGGGGGAAPAEGGGFLSTWFGKATTLFTGVVGALGLNWLFGGE